MTVTTKIRRQGGAAVMTIPPALLKLMGTEIGSEMTLEIDNGNLVASPVNTQKKRYSLAELLEGAEEMAALNADASAWDAAPRVGKEAL
ncbi:AbrB/MazE/SpoVT family DNA-binding domain-containing protein [Agrobacterium rosae]|uniref:Antitoxin PemI n=1 Tax=Agrobacterium rosae TaxID=1972867 RepID=A0A1R3TIL0_9HYPH|nr:PbsX family transcriptional regulator [Agrobacterium rosae]KAA3514387.1 PbsX family transcriptional regulator [Agrobacterium rosae]KAA3523053.1 PbsX family transcriptional regulator [Agrobacterium rosae]MCM2433638.1 PbsX family transcriptional regulator [Agrobacterium rosae]MDX8329803.1 PbsX family transcriptional regulator [Agrobacterium rosae]MQB47765.1 PbsX family transcriptional regulator [Agrobacterium rosae]